MMGTKGFHNFFKTLLLYKNPSNSMKIDLLKKKEDYITTIVDFPKKNYPGRWASEPKLCIYFCFLHDTNLVRLMSFSTIFMCKLWLYK